MNTGFTRSPITGPIRRSKAPGELEFYALFQLLPGPALVIDNTREQITMANSAFLQMTAYSLNELQGRGLRSLVNGLPPHVLSSEEAIGVTLDRRNRTPLTLNLQVRALEPSGAWLALIFEQPEDKNRALAGRMEQYLHAVAEIDLLPGDGPYRKTLEQALGIIRQTLDITSVVLYRVEPGDIQMWRSAQAGEMGVLPDTLPQSDMARLAQPFVWKPGRRVQTELHRTARIANLTYVATTPTSQGGLLVLVDRSQEPNEQLLPIVSAIGKQVSGLLEHLSLVGELRRQALEHRRELSVWRSVGENAQEGLILLAPDLSVSEINQAAEWMLGYADWEARGQPVESILIGPERLLPALETASQGIPTHNMGNVSLHRRNGQSFPAHIQIVPVQREGETLAILIFFSDVSEHVEIRNRTQQLEQRAVLGEVTAVFAHEVRNPINNISTGLQLLTVKLPPEDPNQENINRLLNDCQRLNHLMESVLNFSRQVEHKFEEVDLQMLLGRILDRWRPRLARVNITPHFNVEEGTPHVLADPRSLEQVFTNLISNAVEAMSQAKSNETGSSIPATGALAVHIAPFRALPGKPQVEVTVSDTGPGIPDEIRDRIFEPFVTTKSQGTGLGLAITKRIITAHHGSINVNSFPGGTVFHVLLFAYQGEDS